MLRSSALYLTRQQRNLHFQPTLVSWCLDYNLIMCSGTMSSPSPPLQCGSRDSSICERLQRERVISLHAPKHIRPIVAKFFFSLIILILTRVFRRKIEQQHRHRALWRHLCETVNLRQYRGTFRRNRQHVVENQTLLQFSCFKLQLFRVFAEILPLWSIHSLP